MGRRRSAIGLYGRRVEAQNKTCADRCGLWAAPAAPTAAAATMIAVATAAETAAVTATVAVTAVAAFAVTALVGVHPRMHAATPSCW